MLTVISHKQKLLSFRFVQQNKLHVFLLQIRQRMNVIYITNITIIHEAYKNFFRFLISCLNRMYLLLYLEKKRKCSFYKYHKCLMG